MKNSNLTNKKSLKKTFTSSLMILGFLFLIIASLLYGLNGLNLSRSAIFLIANPTSAQAGLNFHIFHEPFVVSSSLFIVSAFFFFTYYVIKFTDNMILFMNPPKIDNVDKMTNDQKEIAKRLINKKLVFYFFFNFMILFIAIAISISSSFNLNLGLRAESIVATINSGSAPSAAVNNAFTAAHIPLQISGGFLIFAGVMSFFVVVLMTYDKFIENINFNYQKQIYEVKNIMNNKMKMTNLAISSSKSIVFIFIFIFIFILGLFLILFGINSLELGQNAYMLNEGISSLPVVGSTVPLNVNLAFLYAHAHYELSSIVGIVFASFGFFILISLIMVVSFGMSNCKMKNKNETHSHAGIHSHTLNN